MKRFIVMIGWPGSGKSTYIENNAPAGSVVLEGDAIRTMLGNGFYQYNEAYEDVVLNTIVSMAKSLISVCNCVIIDEAKLTLSVLDRIALSHNLSLGASNCSVEFIHINTDADLCKQKRYRRPKQKQPKAWDSIIDWFVDMFEPIEDNESRMYSVTEVDGNESAKKVLGLG